MQACQDFAVWTDAARATVGVRRHGKCENRQTRGQALTTAFVGGPVHVGEVLEEILRGYEEQYPDLRVTVVELS